MTPYLRYSQQSKISKSKFHNFFIIFHASKQSNACINEIMIQNSDLSLNTRDLNFLRIKIIISFVP